MKAITSILLLSAIVPIAHANEYAPVLAKSEIVKDVAVDRQVCRTDMVTVPAERSPGGAIIGGIAGGVLGHTVGRGGGKTAATAVGAITGAIVGDRIDNRDAGSETRPVERCDTVRDHQDEVVGYRVTYEYAGKRYVTRMARDPGDRVELQINVVGGENETPVTYRDEDRPHRRDRRD